MGIITNLLMGGINDPGTCAACKCMQCDHGPTGKDKNCPVSKCMNCSGAISNCNKFVAK